MAEEIKYEWNQVGLEQAFSKFYIDGNFKSKRELISLEWSDFYFKNLFKENPNLTQIQDVLNNLDTSKKYFTVIEIEEGIVNNYSHLDLLVFSPGGKGDVSLPYPVKPMTKFEKIRNIFCSFMGSIETHPIREELFNLFKEKENFQLWKSTTTSMYEYQLSSSVFSLCPRGRGPSSYRFYESLFMGCIPVYISDIFLKPFDNEIDWERLCIMVPFEKINQIPSILSNKTDKEIKDYQEYGKEVYEKYFKFDSLCHKIIDLSNS